MKFFIVISLTALLGFATPLYFAWWSFAVTSFLVALFIQQKPGQAFVAGFFGLFLLWMINAFVIDYKNDHILSQKISALLNLGTSSIPIILITAFVGGLVSAFAALTGSLAIGLRKTAE